MSTRLFNPAIAALRKQIARMESDGRPVRAVLPFGLPDLDRRLPGGGPALGCLREVAARPTRVPDLQVLPHDSDAEAASLERLALWALQRVSPRKSTHRRCLREALETLQQATPLDPQARAIVQIFAAWPRADRLHGMNLDELIAHEAEADALTRTALDLLEKLQETDGQPLEIERFYIQDTTQDFSVSCNEHVEVQRSTGKPVQEVSRGPAPNGAGQGDERKCEGVSGGVKSEWIAKLGPERLFSLASPEMQLYLSGRGDPERLRFHDFIWSAERRLPKLGIHPLAWAEAAPSWARIARRWRC